MAVHNPVQHGHDIGGNGPAHRSGFRVTAWVLGIVGAVAAFQGVFILLAGDDQSIGLGGDASWKVGEIDPAWGWGLAIGGGLALLGAIVLALESRTRPGAAADDRPRGWSDVAAHGAVFLAVNTFLWVQDFAIGGGLDYAYWVTIPWGLGLAAHALAVFFAQRETTPAA